MVGLNPTQSRLVTSRAGTAQLEVPKVEHATSLIHLGLGPNFQTRRSRKRYRYLQITLYKTRRKLTMIHRARMRYILCTSFLEIRNFLGRLDLRPWA